MTNEQLAREFLRAAGAYFRDLFGKNALIDNSYKQAFMPLLDDNALLNDHEIIKNIINPVCKLWEHFPETQSFPMLLCCEIKKAGTDALSVGFFLHPDLKFAPGENTVASGFVLVSGRQAAEQLVKNLADINENINENKNGV